MDDKLFAQFYESTRQMQEIRKGKRKPSRQFTMEKIMKDALGRTLSIWETVICLSASGKLEYALIIGQMKGCPQVRRFNPDGNLRTMVTVIRDPARLMKCSVPSKMKIIADGLKVLDGK